MNRWSDESVPALNPMYRMQWEEAQQAWVLLYPEGMVRLNGPAAEILRRCDGKTTVQALVADLQQAFGEADLRADVVDFLEQAHGRGWLR
jgi:pyrroloquinoline quinone biosynthesis protein D